MGAPSLWHVKVVSCLYHLEEVWGGRKGKKENQQSPNMYRKPQVIGSSSTNVYRAPVVCDTMLPAVSQCKQEYAARMGMGNAKEVG